MINHVWHKQFRNDFEDTINVTNREFEKNLYTLKDESNSAVIRFRSNIIEPDKFLPIILSRKESDVIHSQYRSKCNIGHELGFDFHISKLCSNTEM